jgi:diadenylate cyclase
VGDASSIFEILERLAPGTPMRQALERIIQMAKGGLIVMGSGGEVDDASSGGFGLVGAWFTPARLSELAKMDGGIVVDDRWERIIAANVHFVPDGTIPTDETGSRHRTAERMAIQTKKPVVAVSEGRKVATLYYDGQKVQLDRPTEVAARVNQDLQTLDRLRRRLDDAESRLTMIEVTRLATYRPVVTLLQRTELVRRVGVSIEQEAITLGDEGGLMWVQLADMVRGVEHIRTVTLMDYVKPRRESRLTAAAAALTELTGADLEDPSRVGRAVGFADLDEAASPRGFRLLSKVGRLPDPVREELVRHFKGFDRLLAAELSELEQVEGIGSARAVQLRTLFDRLLSAAELWDPDLD